MSAYQRAKQKPEGVNQVKTNKPEKAASQKMNPQQMLTAPDSLQPEDVLAAQQQFGNQVVQRALEDKHKRQSLTDQQGNLREDISSTIQQARGGGSSMPKELQTEMSHKLGRDFSNVRLHNDAKADKLSRKINARAFTIGTDIFFKSGAFAPASQKGRETLIHELTHVVQQSGSKSTAGKLKLGSPDSAMEQEADRKGKQGSQAATPAAVGSVQRVEEEEELQMQSEEEEEIQMQGEEEELQMQPEEEEEIQMQGEEEELQMQPEDEEEIQMQGEEEELQMQPELGGVVQRSTLSELLKKKKSPQPPSAPEYRPVFGPVKPRGKPLTAKGQKVLSKIKSTKPSGEGLEQELNTKRKAMGLDPGSSQKSKDTHTENIGKLETAQKDRFKQATAKGVDSDKFKRASQREKLMKTIKNPSSSPEDIKAAEDQLRTFHKSGAFKKNPATIAMAERKKSLKKAARLGDDKAAALYSKENPSFMTKAKGFYGKHKGTIGKVMGFLGKGLGIGGGDKEKDKDKGEDKGKGGDGGYAVIISQLMQENKMLKEKLGQK